MRLALTILLVLAALGVLIHAYFAAIRPYDVMLQSIKLLPRLIREKPLLVVTALVLTVLVPFVLPLAAVVSPNGIVRTILALLVQAAITASMALVAVRVHRWIIKRDKSRWLQFGRLEWRMAAIVLAVWALVLFIGAIPALAAALGLPALFVRLSEPTSTLLSWTAVVFLAFAGPAASFRDPRPYRRAVDSAIRQFTAVAALVMLSRGLFSISLIAIAATSQLLDAKPLFLALALPLVLGSAVATFLVSETAIAIALTRCWENTFDEDTRGRDYNADWH